MEVTPSDITEAIRRACNMVKLSVTVDGGSNGAQQASADKEDLVLVLDFIKDSIRGFEGAKLDGYTMDQQCSQMMRILQLISPLRSLKKGIEASLEAKGRKRRTAALASLFKEAERITNGEARYISVERPETGNLPRPSCPGRVGPEEVLIRRRALRQKA